MLRRWDPDHLLDLVERHRAQSVFLVPTHAQGLRSLGNEALGARDVSSLDTLFFNAAALPWPLTGVAGYAFAVPRPFGVTTNPDWLAGKVAAYAVCIACGLAIRVRVTPFGPAWATLLRTGSSPEVERRIRSSVRGTLPFVYAIWALVVVAAVLGVLKPGATAL